MSLLLIKILCSIRFILYCVYSYYCEYNIKPLFLVGSFLYYIFVDVETLISVWQLCHMIEYTYNIIFVNLTSKLITDYLLHK